MLMAVYQQNLAVFQWSLFLVQQTLKEFIRLDIDIYIAGAHGEYLSFHHITTDASSHCLPCPPLSVAPEGHPHLTFQFWTVNRGIIPSMLSSAGWDHTEQLVLLMATACGTSLGCKMANTSLG